MLGSVVQAVYEDGREVFGIVIHVVDGVPVVASEFAVTGGRIVWSHEGPAEIVELLVPVMTSEVVESIPAYSEGDDGDVTGV